MFFKKKKDAERQTRMTRLLDTVNTAVTILLTSNADASFDSALLKSFDLIGHCLDIDRVQIWRSENFDEERHFVLRHEWLSDHGKNLRPMPYGLHFPYNMKKQWEKSFLFGINVNSPVSKLPDEDKEYFQYYELKSIVMIPMFLEGDLWGVFSINDCRREHTFSGEEISILTSAGLMMSTAVNRNIQIMKMREAEERTQIMIDAAPLCAFIWDQNMSVVDCNQEAVNMFEMINKQDFIMNFTKLSPKYQPDGSLSGEMGGRLVKKALDEGYSRFEWMHQKLNGEPMPTEVTCVRVKHRDSYTVTEYIRDLREQKAMIAEMRKAEIAEESSKAKSDFLAKMSHEIRTPMNAILGITEIHLQDASIGQSTKDALERIYNSADLLLGIINDILDLSKIEAGKLELNIFQYDIASLINDTVQLNMMRYESKPIEFRLEIDENVPIMLIGDELRIKQILNNLLSNAYKYTQEGMITLTISCEPPKQDNPDVTIIFSIIDTGQGMSDEQVQKLGNEYSRFNMEANRRTVGTGLGMNITRNLLKMMNGEIIIDSTPGMGSTFTVRLPQKCADSETIGSELAGNLMQLNMAGSVKLKTVQIRRDYMPYGSVLVVDDVETNLYVAKGLMIPYGLKIDTVMSGFDAIEKIRSGKTYDAVFMDHMMPGMDGIETVKLIRNFGYTKPIIALTANALAGQAEMFMQNGFDDFISKPIDIRQLNLSLNRFIRDKQPPEVLKAAKKQREQMKDGVIQPSVAPEIAEFFLRDAKKAAAIMESIYLNKCRRVDDVSMFIINIHAMKSALANVGETNLSSEAAKLEKAGRDKDVNFILTQLPVFLERLYNIIHSFESKERLPGEEKKIVGEISFLKEKLAEICAACSTFNKKKAKDLLAEIRLKSWPPATEECLGNIAGFLLHSEFDEAVKTIEELIKQI